MEFSYRAQKENGEMLKGVLEAPDRFALARLVKDRGAVLIYAEPAGQLKPLARWSKMFTRRPRQKEMMLFVGNLGALLAAGLSLSRALAVLARQAKQVSFQEAIKNVSREIARGTSLHQSFAAEPKIFPKVLVAMVAAGEESGTLAETFKLSSEQLAKSYEIRRKVRGAMIYPAVIIGVIIIIAILMMIFMVPTLSATFLELGVELPLATRVVIGISNFLVNFWYLVIAALVLLGVGLMAVSRAKTGKKIIDKVILKLPIVGDLVTKTNSGLVMRTSSSLVSAGVSMVETLRIASEVTKNSLYQEALLKASEDIQKGITLSAIFKNQEKLFPPLVGELTEVGEETGELSGMLLRGATFYEGEVDQAVKNLSTVIEPALMVAVGIAVGFFALAMIGPMYSLSDVI